MDENTKLPRVPPEAVQPETVFAEFFHGVISSVYDLTNRQILNNVLSALKDTRRLKRDNGNCLNAYLSFKRPQARCAYLYDCSVLHCTMVYSEFSALLKQSKMYLLPACRRDSLKICCLGGGPGIESVAICKSIRDMILEPDLASNHSISVHVTMIDKHPHWRKEVSGLVNAMNDSSNPLHSCRTLLHSDFMKADVSKPFEKSLIQKIHEADIVTVVKLNVSPENNSPESGDWELRMIENIIGSMREGSCLFMLDNDEGKFFNNKVKCLTDKGPYSHMKTSMYNAYNLDARTIKKFKDLLKIKKDLNNRLVLPAIEGKACACMWIKNANNFTSNSVVPDENNIERTSNCRSADCALQSEKGNSSAIQDSCSSKASNDDEVTSTKYADENTEQRKKKKHTLKKLRNVKVANKHFPC